MYNNYPYQFQNNYQPQWRQEIIKVTGENGARAYQLTPNSSALLLDDTSPIVWLVQADGAGYKTVTPYKIEPYNPNPAPDYNDLSNRITRLEEMINEQSNTSSAKRKQSNGADRGDKIDDVG